MGQTNREINVHYSYAGGVDFTGDHKTDGRRPVYMENLYRDYEGTGGDILESIPGFRKLTSCDYRINGIFKASIGLIIHAGTSLILATLDENGEVTEKREIGTLSDAVSRAFAINRCVYILDGSSITCIDETGTAYKIGEDDGSTYVPTTYYNGVPYEERNLLTDDFEEKMIIPNAEDYRLGSDGLLFRVTDYETKKCAVSGTNDAFAAEYASIPAFVTIGGEKYSVVSIDDGAFRPGTIIKELHFGEGISTIGKSAFAGCTYIERIFFPRTLTEIGDEAFAGCSALVDIYLFLGFEKFGTGAFERCEKLTNVYYTGTESDFKKITNYSSLLDNLVANHQGYFGLRMELPLSKEAKSIKKVYIGDTGYAFTTRNTADGKVLSAIVSIYNKRTIAGKVARIVGTYDDREDNLSEAVRSCTVFEIYDGRAFLSGSKNSPGAVFYSGTSDDGSPDMRYFGEYDRFKDGTGECAVVAMLGVHDGLAVFCDSDFGGGGIFYHTRVNTGDGFIHTAYPVSYIHSGISTRGGAISFFDDPVFLTDGGLFGIDMKRLDYDRSISCRSTLINPYLLTENLKGAHLARWRGYLVLATGEHVYLADSRGIYTNALGTREYEWYFLSGIGTRRGAESVYRYSSVAKDGFYVHRDCDEITDKTVMSVSVDGEQYYYVTDGEKRYAVHKTEEVRGGTFYPLSALYSSYDNELFFGTECGDVCIFNSDKRGIAPDFIRKDADFDEEEYKNNFSRKIHPYFYSFAGVSPTYALKTAKDNCGMSNVLKNTVKHSLAFTCRASVGRPVLEVGTDKRGYREVWHLPNAEVDFSYLDFASLSFSTSERITVPMSEKEKGWIEKQIAVYSKDFCSPIGISEISYRFTVKGRIKKN